MYVNQPQQKICQIIRSSHVDHFFIVIIIVLRMQYLILLKPHRILLATSYQRLGSTDTWTLSVSVPDNDNGALEALTNYYSVYNGQKTPFCPYDVCCTEYSQGLLCPVNARCP